MKQVYTLLLAALFAVGTASAQTEVFNTVGNAPGGFVAFGNSNANGTFGFEDFQIDQSSFANQNAPEFRLDTIEAAIRIASSDGEGAQVDFDFYDASGAYLGTETSVLGQDGAFIWTISVDGFTTVPTDGFVALYLDSTAAYNLGRLPEISWFIVDNPDPSLNEPAFSGRVGNSPSDEIGIDRFGSAVNFYVKFEGREINSTLPVELTAFDAEADARGVDLAWTTAQERDNAGFEVERSTDGVDFASVDFVEGAGHSDAATDYAFTDVTVAAGATYYYRLRQLDFDGAESYSPVRVVTTGSVASELLAEDFAPNPARERTSLEIVLRGDAEVTTELFDVTGKRVFVQHTAAEAGVVTESVDVSALPAGVYQAVITAGDQMLQRRLTVQ